MKFTRTPALLTTTSNGRTLLLDRTQRFAVVGIWQVSATERTYLP